MLGLQRFEEACFYYEKACEACEKYPNISEKIGGKVSALEDSFNRYDNYSTALFFTGLSSRRYDLPEKAFAYKKKAIRSCRLSHQEEHTLPDLIPELVHGLGRITVRLTEQNKSRGTACFEEMCQIFDVILDEDEGRLVLNEAHMGELPLDYRGVFWALNKIPGSEEVHKRYLDRCRDSVLSCFDNRIQKAAKKPESDGALNLAVENYNKSRALLPAGTPCVRQRMSVACDHSDRPPVAAGAK